jgi:hypothetical protein
MPCLFLPCSKLRRAPVESYLKFFMGIIGALGEYITGYNLVDIPVKQSETNSSMVNLGAHEHHHDHGHSIHARSANNDPNKMWVFADGNCLTDF